MIVPPRPFTRRSFLKTTGALSAGALLPAWFAEETLAAAATTKPLSPNDKPGLALIGCGGRGRGIGREAAAFGNMLAVCDVDAGHLDQAAQLFPGATRFSDFRKLMQRDDIHVVINGTPDHWHTLINLHALRSGKDVYSEKPLTLTIDEGRRLVAAVQQTKRVLQTGSQQRSDPRFRLACELVRNGRIGKLTQVLSVLPAGPHGGPFAPSAVPAGLDWDFWQGQTRAVEYIQEKCHGSFRYWYDYSGGTMTDWGAHHNDIALWGIGQERSGPTQIEGKPLVEEVPGGYTAASQYRVEYTYANSVKHTCRSVAADNPAGRLTGKLGAEELPNGVKFEGSNGWIFVSREKLEASQPELLSTPLAANAHRLYASNHHLGNFFDCVRSRKAPVAEAEIGHRSVSVCHLGVLALRLGRVLHWDPEHERFVNDKDADRYLVREMRQPWSYESM